MNSVNCEKSMKILLAHPYRHHSYYSFLGIRKYSDQGRAFYGYYKKGDLLDRIVEKTSFRSKLCGYDNSQIDNEYIITQTKTKLEFLLAKANPQLTQRYIIDFDKQASRYVPRAEVLHVLQDYCNESIREAYKREIPIIYEQIQPYDPVQAQILAAEVEKEGFSKAYVSNRFPKWQIEKQQENLEMASAVIAASKMTERTLKGVVKGPVYTFSYGADVSACSELRLNEINDRRLKSKKIRVLYVGAMNLLKGVRYVIEAARQLQNEPFKFTFIGRAPTEEDKCLVDQIQSLKNCTYIESIPHVQMNEEYQKHDIFVFQGICEGFGMVSLEAMSNGLPCLLSENACGIIEDGVDGFINETCNVQQLVRNLQCLESDRNLLNRMGEQARRAARECTWDVFSKNICNVYETQFSGKSEI